MKHPTNRLERKLIDAKKRKNKYLSAREKEVEILTQRPWGETMPLSEPEDR
jgi:hypothetical protein